MASNGASPTDRAAPTGAARFRAAVIAPVSTSRSGWVLLDEPELHLASDSLVPDLAGWRSARMPVLPDDAFTSVAPDWVCEVLSAPTEQLDRVDNSAVNRVAHVWRRPARRRSRCWSSTA
jgi:hypothetical protein